MPLSTANLIELFRSEMSDPELPGSGDDSDSLWFDSEITDWLGEAQNELCERVDLLFDRSSFKIDTVEEQDLYAIDDQITKIRRGVGADGRKLEAISIKELERKYEPNDWDYANDDAGILNHEWESLIGLPKYIITDFAVGYARLVPIPPSVAGTLLYSGTHTSGTPSSTILTDTNANGGAGWVVDALIGNRITNTTDGISALITDNDATTVTTAALASAWDQDDAYTVEEEVADTEEINLDVYRLPADPEVMEIPNKHRRMLLHKVKAMGYRKDDIDTQDMNRAAVYEAKWEAALDDVDRQFKRLNRGPQVTSYGGIPMGGMGGRSTRANR